MWHDLSVQNFATIYNFSSFPQSQSECLFLFLYKKKGCCKMITGWPDEFVKNIAQNVAEFILVKFNA
jgi:hypothetical protein